MSELRNDTSERVWFEGGSTDGEALVLDGVEGMTVFVRSADPSDDTTARVPVDPGQRIAIATPVGCIAICLSDQSDANDAIYWLRVVPDGRADGVVYGRTLAPGEEDDGRRVHIRPGERFELPMGSVQISLDEIEEFYRNVDPDRRSGSLAAVVRVWHATRAIEPIELQRVAQAAAHRLDAANYLLRQALATGEDLRTGADAGGPRLLLLVDEYLHLVQETIVALARGVALVERARELIDFETEWPLVLEAHSPALRAIRDAYEHIDERASAKARKVEDIRNLMIFDHGSLVGEGLIEYFDHKLRVDDLSLVADAARTAIKQVIGGAPRGSDEQAPNSGVLGELLP
jgi:hypothetical protein